MSTSLLIDTDPGNDDAVLLALATVAEGIDVVGVTSVAGNDRLEHTTWNASAVLDWFGNGDVPVAPGAAAPLIRELETASAIHGPRGLHELPPEPTNDPVSTAGANAIVEQARTHPEKLTLVAVGPLTNVALALALEPDLPDLLDDLYVMGGAAFVGGNVTPMAEYNFYADPEAARRVVREAHPKLVGLDVTNHATVPPKTIREWAMEQEPFRTMAAWMAYTSLENLDQALADDGPASVHDATVGVELLTEILTFEPSYAEIETCGSCRGTLICDDQGVTGNAPNVEVAVDIDAAAFRETLLETLRTINTES